MRILQDKPHLITNNHYYIFNMYLNPSITNNLQNIVNKHHFENNIPKGKPMNNYQMSKINLKYTRYIMNLMDLSSMNRLDHRFSILLINLRMFIMGNFRHTNFS